MTIATAKNKARVARAHLLCHTPRERMDILRPVAKGVDLAQVPDSEIIMACTPGLGEVGMRELIVCLGLYLLEHDIQEMPET